MPRRAFVTTRMLRGRAARRATRDEPGIGAAHARRRAGALDERHVGGAAAGRLEPEGSAAGVQVEHACTIEQGAGVERREDRLTHAVARGARARLRHLQGEGAREAGDDARHEPHATAAGREGGTESARGGTVGP